MTQVPQVIDWRLPGPRKLTMNDRMHWATRATVTRQWRRLSMLCARDAINSHAATPATSPVTITVTLPFRDRRIRDPHNWAPTVKAIVDGLADAGMLPHGDSAEWVRNTDPVLEDGGRSVRVTISPIPA